jgi:hypothetical protein
MEQQSAESNSNHLDTSTTSSADVELLQLLRQQLEEEQQSKQEPRRPDLLPPPVQLVWSQPQLRDYVPVTTSKYRKNCFH